MENDRQDSKRPLHLMQSFWQLQKSIMGTVKQTADDNDLSVPQFAIMVLMRHDKQMAQKKLQHKTHYPKSTLSHAIEGLVQAELLNRTPVEDNRREMELSLSDQGELLLDDITSQEDGVHTRFKRAVDSFTEEEFSELIQLHQHIVTFFEKGDEQ